MDKVYVVISSSSDDIIENKVFLNKNKAEELVKEWTELYGIFSVYCIQELELVD